MRCERKNKENLFRADTLAGMMGRVRRKNVTLVDEDVGNESFLEERPIPTALGYLLRPSGGEPG